MVIQARSFIEQIRRDMTLGINPIYLHQLGEKTSYGTIFLIWPSNTQWQLRFIYFIIMALT